MVMGRSCLIIWTTLSHIQFFLCLFFLNYFFSSQEHTQHEWRTTRLHHISQSGLVDPFLSTLPISRDLLRHFSKY